MESTLRRTLALLGVALVALAVGTAGAQARSSQPNAPAHATCRTLHEGAMVFCNAVSDRKTIRVLRRMVIREAHRAHVPVPMKMRPLRWNPAWLQRSNEWHRRVLSSLEAMPTWQPLPNLSAWICIHEHEGPWNARGFYEGGLQMDRPFSHTYGADMYVKYGGDGPYAWSPRDQIIVAIRAYDSGRGFGPWPNTRLMCGV